MKFLFVILELYLYFCHASAVIFRLNSTEYVRMPPLFHLDPYELCVYKPKGLYCTVEIDLVSDGSTDEGNDLMEMIRCYKYTRKFTPRRSYFRPVFYVIEVCSANVEQVVNCAIGEAVDVCETIVRYVSRVTKVVGLAIIDDASLILPALIAKGQEYSARTETHYNHTRLHHGICVTDICQKYLAQNTTEDLKVVIEGCLNSSFWEKYKLKTRINEDLICNNKDQTFELEPGDIGVAVIMITLVILNISGIIYDCFTFKKKDHEVNKLLRCFSIRHNWLKLVAPVANGNEPRFKRLKSFNGLRAITMFLVITEHALLPFMVASDNTLFLEDMYHNILYHLYFDGTILVQTFFIISGCLLAYYLQIWSEKKDLNWKMIPKGIVKRWLRLSPSYAVALAISLTWLRRFGSGPLWEQIVNNEVQDCRRDGWLHLILINNYIDNSLCMTHSWYLAADMQLYIFGLVLLIMVRTEYARKVALSVMFVVALIIPALHTYIQNLNAYFLPYPESTRFFFIADPTFNNTYKRGHTNLANYILGLGLGLLIHKMQKEKFNIKKYRKFIFLYWAIVPVGIGVMLCSGLFYMDGASPPLLLKAVYSGLVKPVIGFLVSVLILGLVFKMENIYRGILEWQGWTCPARVSYSAYLIHMLLIRSITGSRTTLIHATFPYFILIQVGTGILCYLVAFPFWLLIEAPIAQLVNLIMPMKDIEKVKSN